MQIRNPFFVFDNLRFMVGCNKTICGWIAAVVCLLCVSVCHAEQPTKSRLTYFGDDPYAALSVAKKQRKLLLVEFYAPWNHRSRWMSERVLGDSTIRALVEANFIAVQVPTGTRKGADMAEIYQVTKYPAILIFSSNGEVLDKVDVTLDVEDFEKRIETVLMTINGIGVWRLNPIYEAAERVDYEATDVAVLGFLRGQLPHDVVSSVVWPMFENGIVTRYGSAAFNYLVMHVEMFRKENGKEAVDVVLIDALQAAMLPYVLGSVPYVAGEAQNMIRMAKELELPIVLLLESMSDVAVLRSEEDLSLFVGRMGLLLDMAPEFYQLSLALSLEVVAERGTREQKNDARDMVNSVSESIESPPNMVLLAFLSERLK